MNRVVHFVASVAVTAGTTLAVAVDADWTEFRGSTTAGNVSPSIELPTRWDKSAGIRWRSEIPGSGWSSPVVADGSVYLTSAISNDTDGYDLCLVQLDVRTGEVQKTTRVFGQSGDAPKIHKKNSHASPTPIIEGGYVFVHFGHQGTACLTLNGEITWKNDGLTYPPVHGNGGSPTIVRDLLIFSRDGADLAVITALNKTTGELVWEVEREVEASRQFSFCTPLFVNAGGREQLIVPGSNVVQSLNPDDGSEYWRLRYDGYSVIPRPVYHEGLVFVCTGYNKPSILAIDPTGSGDVTESHLKWQSNSNVPHTPSLATPPGRIAMVSDRGIASCLDARTGTELWKSRIGGNFSASPILHGETLYLLSEDGVCTILDIGSDSPVETSVNAIGERCLASFAVTESDFLLRSEQALYRISASQR